MKVWITTYALSEGILEHEAEKTHSESMIAYDNGRYAHGNDWHKNKEAAIARAEQMRTKKIASLKKQLAALEKLEFTA